MEKVTREEQEIINNLTANWVWTSDWSESSTVDTAGRLVTFEKSFHIHDVPIEAIIHCSADTRYKLLINGKRIAVGPARSSTSVWFYDTLDILNHLRRGRNQVKFIVVRYFAASRHAMHFPRTACPGLTVIGKIENDGAQIDLSTNAGWTACVDYDTTYPYGLVDDVFLHINERKSATSPSSSSTPKPYNIKTVNGELSPWPLRPRGLPMPVESPIVFSNVHNCRGTISARDWSASLKDDGLVLLPEFSVQQLDVVAEVHSTAFLTWQFRSEQANEITLKVTYSEGYEREPRAYPFFRVKDDCLDHGSGLIIGPFDQVKIKLPAGEIITYEPFWFRTFRVLRIELQVGSAPVQVRLSGCQTNYPINNRGQYQDMEDPYSGQIWDVAIRTMRNCMFDGYSDCPFYEQLQYVGDSRTAGLFHYLISGDDRLMRRTISSFAMSITVNGLTQSRFPSHIPQIIAGFSLIWILQVCDHYLHFGDTTFARSFLPRIDGVLEFFQSHIDGRELVANLPEDVWQFVDWVTTWGATDSHPDKGVPTAGRSTNTHTYFSMLYVHVLDQTATLVESVGRPALAAEYRERAETTRQAIRKHCYDGTFFTDSTTDIRGEGIYSQHCQVFAVLSQTALPVDRARILTQSFKRPDFSKCSYMMMFYAFRAFAAAGVYDDFWPEVLDPWRSMLDRNLTTFEEDNVRQRSSCHCWSSVPIYEYATEIAGVRVIGPGSSAILFSPRVNLSRGVNAKVALGPRNLATVSWSTLDDETREVKLRLDGAIHVISKLPGGTERDHGVVSELALQWRSS